MFAEMARSEVVPEQGLLEGDDEEPGFLQLQADRGEGVEVDLSGKEAAFAQGALQPVAALQVRQERQQRQLVGAVLRKQEQLVKAVPRQQGQLVGEVLIQQGQLVGEVLRHRLQLIRAVLQGLVGALLRQQGQLVEAVLPQQVKLVEAVLCMSAVTICQSSALSTTPKYCWEL
jgi:exoribonuclease R